MSPTSDHPHIPSSILILSLVTKMQKQESKSTSSYHNKKTCKVSKNLMKDVGIFMDIAFEKWKF